MKQFIIALCIILSSGLNAQIQKGQVLIGGDIYFYSNNESEEFGALTEFLREDYNSRLLKAGVHIGVFATNSSVLGLGFGYENDVLVYKDSYKGKMIMPTEKRSHLFLINPFYRKYTKLVDRLYLTTTVNAIGGKGKKGYGEDQEFKTDLLKLGTNITPGVSYILKSNFIITGSFGRLYYNYTRETLPESVAGFEDLENTKNSYGFNGHFNTFKIGFQYLFNQNDSE